MRTIGSRAEVFHKKAKKTSGGLTKDDLMMNKHGRIVSKKKHNTSKKEMRLLKHGYGTKKGKFGFIKVGSRKRKSSRKMHGGNISGTLSPASAVGWESVNDSNSMQMRAGMSGGSGMKPLSNAEEVGGSNALQFRAGMSGGSGMKPLSNAAEVSGSNAVQFRAGMSGGRRSRRRKSRRHK